MPSLMMFNPPESNPRRKRSRRKRVHKKARRRARARRNPAPPIRRRRRSGRPKRHARARRNPSGHSLMVAGVDVGRVGIGILGAGTADVLGEFAAQQLPATMDPNLKIAARYGIKGVLVSATAFGLGKTLGRTAGAAAAIGGFILIGMDAARQFLFPALKLPHGGLSGLGLVPEDLAGYRQDMLPVGVSGYSRPGPGSGSLREYSSGLAGGSFRPAW